MAAPVAKLALQKVLVLAGMWESVRVGEAAPEEAPDQVAVAEHLLPALGVALERQEAADQVVPPAWPFSEAACAANLPSRRYLESSG